MWFGLHNTNGSSIASCLYGIQCVGLDSDNSTQVTMVHPIFDIAVTNLKNSSGGLLSAGDTCTIYIKGTCNSSGCQIMFGKVWNSLISSTSNPLVGSFKIEVFSLSSKNSNPIY